VTEKRVGPPGRMPGWEIYLAYTDETGRVISHTSRVSVARSKSAVIGEEHVVAHEAVVGIRSIISFREQEKE
jgi:hypothetical protein